MTNPLIQAFAQRIGTEIATQVLHDGDLVEVDADSGVVRVIERAKK